MYKLVHIDEEVEEHLDTEVPRVQVETQTSETKEIPPQTINIGFYFAGAVIVLVAIGFFIYWRMKE